MSKHDKRTVKQRFASAHKYWAPPYGLGMVQRLTWTLSDLGWQFPEAVRVRYVYWRSGNEWQGPGFPWIRK